MAKWKVTITMSDGKEYGLSFDTRMEAVHVLMEIDRCMEKGCMYWLDGSFDDRRLLNPYQMVCVRKEREI